MPDLRILRRARALAPIGVRYRYEFSGGWPGRHGDRGHRSSALSRSRGVGAALPRADAAGRAQLGRADAAELARRAGALLAEVSARLRRRLGRLLLAERRRALLARRVPA